MDVLESNGRQEILAVCRKKGGSLGEKIGLRKVFRMGDQGLMRLQGKTECSLVNESLSE